MDMSIISCRIISSSFLMESLIGVKSVEAPVLAFSNTDFDAVAAPLSTPIMSLPNCGKAALDVKEPTKANKVP